MKKLLQIPVLLFVLMLIVSSCGKDTKSDADFSNFIINIEKPEGWFDMNTRNVIGENIKRIEMRGITDKMLSEINADSVLYFFTKYDLSKGTRRVSPSINVSLRKNNDGYTLEDIIDQGELMPEVSKSMGLEEYSLKGNDYVYLSNGKKSVEQKSTFKLPNRAEKITSTTYFFFISDKWYIQLSFSGIDDDNCDDIFKEVLENL